MSKNRPKGRRTAYAFYVQHCREVQENTHPTEKIDFSKFLAGCLAKWKTMLDEEKESFHEMANKDKKRYSAEMQNYRPPEGEKQHSQKRKKILDDNRPKRPLTAFFWFCNDERSKVNAQYPEFGAGDIAKELVRRWTESYSEVKSKYEAIAEKDKARYEMEKKADNMNKKNPKLHAGDPEEEDEDE